MTALADVADVERFVRWQVQRTLAKNEYRLTSSEIEEAVSEGIVQLFELHTHWDEARCPRFSALALELLPKRLISWWRVQLRQSGRGSYAGKTNTYTYRDLVSYDAIREEREDRHPVFADHA